MEMKITQARFLISFSLVSSELHQLLLAGSFGQVVGQKVFAFSLGYYGVFRIVPGFLLQGAALPNNFCHLKLKK